MAERIVVGVDGSEGSRRALSFAAAQAVLRRAVLEVVATWQRLPGLGEWSRISPAKDSIVQAADKRLEASSGDRILVGVDGSNGSAVALRWALAEARRRGAPVAAEAICRLPFEEEGSAELDLSHFRRDLRLSAEHVEELLSETVRRPSRLAPTAEVPTAVLEGEPAGMLCEESSSAALLVVGARGHGALPGLVLGSAGTRCARLSRCLVAIVPAASTETMAPGELASAS
jgi:nucleotide-binding universal stress UspA family protein